MNKFSSITALIITFAACLASTAPAGAEVPYLHETKAQRDDRMAWWREAKFGLFVHWGVYAVPAGWHNGKRVNKFSEWIMHWDRIPIAEYQKYAKQFNPTKFDAERWVLMAKDAGMKYIVITAKHHDGFAMFDTAASPWNIMQASPYGKDPLKELAAACRKHQMKLGFYYSQAQDWTHGGATDFGNNRTSWDPAQKDDMDAYIDKVAVPQVKELLSNYGEFPQILWWDTPTNMTAERARKLGELLNLKPGIIHNNRLGGEFKGDTETPEGHVPATGFPGRDWETCMTFNESWGYRSDDQKWKSTETLLGMLIDIASKGGNFLLNVGPDADGVVPQGSVDRLAEIGRWMKVNGAAIYGTTATPFSRPFVSAGNDVTPEATWRCTRKPGKLFVHLLQWPADGKFTINDVKIHVVKASMLADPKQQALAFSNNEGVLSISLPGSAPDKIASVLVLDTVGAVELVSKESKK